MNDREDRIEKIRRMGIEEKESTILSIEKSASEYERLYGGCARSTLRALQEHLGIGSNDTFRAATPFSGGTGRSGEVCGALVGAIMAIGLVYADGEFEEGKPESRPLCVRSSHYEKTMERTIKLCDQFRGEFGGLKCPDVMSKLFGKVWDLRDPEMRVQYSQPSIHDRCGEVTGKTARLVATLILEND
jgi:C_GCAxxG_C_C family probable redox protein